MHCRFLRLQSLLLLLLLLLFHWLYSPQWALACRTMSFHFFLSVTNSVHLLTPSTSRSLSVSSFHPFLGLPLRLGPSSSWVKIFLGILSSSILSRWPNLLILCHLIHFTIFSPLLTSSNSRLVLLFHSPFSYLAPCILLYTFLSKISRACSSFFVIVHVIFLLGNENKPKGSANWIIYKTLVLNCTDNSQTPVLLIRDLCRHIVQPAYAECCWSQWQYRRALRGNVWSNLWSMWWLQSPYHLCDWRREFRWAEYVGLDCLERLRERCCVWVDRWQGSRTVPYRNLPCRTEPSGAN